MGIVAPPGGPQAHVLNPANGVTALRLVMAVGVAGAIITWGAGSLGRTVACVVFIVAMSSDWLDGHLARRYNWVTEFGQWFDPLADKVVVGLGLVLLSVMGSLWWTVTLLVLARELAMTLMREAAKRRNLGSMPASRAGKLKTLAQAVAIPVFLAPLEVWAPGTSLIVLRVVLMAAVVGLAYFSLAAYVLQYRRLLASRSA